MPLKYDFKATSPKLPLKVKGELNKVLLIMDPEGLFTGKTKSMLNK
jgi:hypothetical protein